MKRNHHVFQWQQVLPWVSSCVEGAAPKRKERKPLPPIRSMHRGGVAVAQATTPEERRAQVVHTDDDIVSAGYCIGSHSDSVQEAHYFLTSRVLTNNHHIPENHHHRCHREEIRNDGTPVPVVGRRVGQK
jgi:hypothetical protein